MWSVNNESLEENPHDLLLDGFGIGLSKEIENGAAEVLGVTVGIPQVVDHGIQKQIATCEKHIKSNQCIASLHSKCAGTNLQYLNQPLGFGKYPCERSGQLC